MNPSKHKPIAAIAPVVRVIACAALGSAVLVALWSCSAADPGLVVYRERDRSQSLGPNAGGSNASQPGGATDAGGQEDGDDNAGDSDAASMRGDAQANGTASATANEVNAVFGGSAFVAGMPGPGAPAKAANRAHAGDASGKDCMTCHAQDWAFSGTLYGNAQGEARERVEGAEIRIAGPDGKEFVRAYSDVDGNFWTEALATGIPSGSRVGVRTAAGAVRVMKGAIGPGQGGCNANGTCHGPSGSAGRVFVR